MIVLKIIGIIFFWLALGCLAVKILTRISSYHFNAVWFTIIIIFAPATFIISMMCLILKTLYDIYSEIKEND